MTKLPDRPSEAAPFHLAARQGRLVLPRCSACLRLHWYPRALCPFCAAPDPQWLDSPGLGRVHSVTVFRSGPVPRIIAYVDLDEGLRMLTTIEADLAAGVPIGQRVRVRFRPMHDESGQLVPVFVPVSDDCAAAEATVTGS